MIANIHIIIVHDVFSVFLYKVMYGGSGLFSYILLQHSYINWGHVVAQLVEALRYKPEVCGFDYWWCHWNFFLT
jgi:hypothetical protein